MTDADTARTTPDRKTDEPVTRRPVRRRRLYVVLLAFLWLLALPVCALLFALLAEGALASLRARAITALLLVGIPVALGYECWRWATGQLNERRRPERRDERRGERRQEDRLRHEAREEGGGAERAVPRD